MEEVSEVPVLSLSASNPKGEAQHVQSENIDWEYDRRNARNWSPSRKAATAAVVSGIGFVWYASSLS